MKIQKVATVYPETKKEKGKLADVFEKAGYIVQMDAERYDGLYIFEQIK